MHNITALERMFSVSVFCILFAGALSQGVNDWGNDIYMWYCSVREHDLVRRFVDWHMLNFM